MANDNPVIYKIGYIIGQVARLVVAYYIFKWIKKVDPSPNNPNPNSPEQ